MERQPLICDELEKIRRHLDFIGRKDEAVLIEKVSEFVRLWGVVTFEDLLSRINGLEGR